MKKNNSLKKILVFSLIFSSFFLIISWIYSKNNEEKDLKVEVYEKKISSVDYYNSVERVKDVEVPKIDSKAAYSVYLNQDGEDILFSRNRNKQLPIASLTKLMTALVIYENYDLNQQIGISDSVYFTDSHLRDLRIFSTTTFRELLYPLLIESNNSGAYAAAIAPKEISFNDFISLMNESAEEIGMERTLFYNPSGLDNEKGNNLSTAKDLSKLVKKVLEIPLFREILKKDHYQLSSKNSSVHYTSRTTNKFINGSYFEIRPDWYERIVAGKTGFTYSAGGCLVIVLEDENKDGYIINIILGTDGHQERFEEMEKLINWVERAYKFN
jgi:D-alanyl-D-alanine carboxypeptidase